MPNGAKNNISSGEKKRKKATAITSKEKQPKKYAQNENDNNKEKIQYVPKRMKQTEKKRLEQS